MAHQMTNSTQVCFSGDAPVGSHSSRYPSPESDNSDSLHEAMSQDAVQYSPDECQIALDLQKSRLARESLQQYASYPATQGNASYIRYSVGPNVASQSPHPPPIDAYYPLLATPGGTFQHHAMIASQPHPDVSSSAYSPAMYLSQVPGYIGPYLSSETFSQQQAMPTPISTPCPRGVTIPQPFPSTPFNIPAHYSQPVEQPVMGIVDASMSRSRSQLRRHACTVCDKRFPRPSSLKTHLLTHSGEKPHLCPVQGCDRHEDGNGFSVRSNMTRHVKTRHKDWNGEIGGPPTIAVMTT